MADLQETKSNFDREYSKSTDMYSSSFRVSEIDRFRTTLNLIKRHCSKDAFGLDIGCGPGNFSVQIKDCLQHLIATDISEVVIKKAKQLHQSEHLQFEVGGLPNTNFEDNQFDFISALEIIYYLNDEERIAAINEIARILKPNGVFVLSGIISSKHFNFKELSELFDNNFELVEEKSTYRKIYNKLESSLQKIQKHIFRNSKLTEGIMQFPSRSWFIMRTIDGFSRFLIGKPAIHRIIRVYRRK